MGVEFDAIGVVELLQDVFPTAQQSEVPGGRIDFPFVGAFEEIPLHLAVPAEAPGLAHLREGEDGIPPLDVGWLVRCECRRVRYVGLFVVDGQLEIHGACGDLPAQDQGQQNTEKLE